MQELMISCPAALDMLSSCLQSGQASGSNLRREASDPAEGPPRLLSSPHLCLLLLPAVLDPRHSPSSTSCNVSLCVKYLDPSDYREYLLSPLIFSISSGPHSCFFY